MRRTVLVGDIHGCRNELDRLLEYIGFTQDDQLVAVGDLVVRGPDPHGTLKLLRRVGALAVRGNHEDRLLRFLHRVRAAEYDPKRDPLGDAQRATVRELTKRDWAMLNSLPLWIDLPQHGIRVVHAGLVPGVPIEAQAPRTLMYVRCLTPEGKPDERRGDDLWGKAYEGSPHIVFGHNAMLEPQIHPWATGLDTGAVYGGALTAMVLREGERPPPLADRRDVLVSIRARKRYCDK